MGFSLVLLSAVVPLLVLLLPPTVVAKYVSTTASCTDGSDISWQTRVDWGAKRYQRATKTYVIDLRLVEWTANQGMTLTDSTVTTYSDGREIEVLRDKGWTDFDLGATSDSRNPQNPPFAPGTTKVAITLGKEGGSSTCTVVHRQPTTYRSDHPQASALGPSRSGLPWHSGVWLGGRFSAKSVDAFGRWRGRPADVVTTFAPRQNYNAIMSSGWGMETWEGFEGRLNYGLPLLPDDGTGDFRSIAAGDHDFVWRKVAQELQASGHGDSIIRVGWEPNSRSHRWLATAGTADEYKAAYRRVVQIMRTEAPGLTFDFNLNCGTGLEGSSDRLAPLTMLYPGDDVVDFVGCDIYDRWSTHAADDYQWRNVLRPSNGPGLQDVIDFARARGKGATIPEWGLARREGENNGGGDNPYYIRAMYEFFSANSDIIAFECYFDEPGSIQSSLFESDENRRAAAIYAQLWDK